MADRPNILFLLTDQQRAGTIAALGNSLIEASALDRIANAGVAFTRVSGPSHGCKAAEKILLMTEVTGQSILSLTYQKTPRKD